MLQNLIKGKIVEWIVLLVALVALGLSIAAVAKPCNKKDSFASALKNDYVRERPQQYPAGQANGKITSSNEPCYLPSVKYADYCNEITPLGICQYGYICRPGDTGRSNMGYCYEKHPGEQGQLITCNEPPPPDPPPTVPCCDYNQQGSDCLEGQACLPDSRCKRMDGLPGYSCQSCSDPSCQPCIRQSGDCGEPGLGKCCPGLQCKDNFCMKPNPPEPSPFSSSCEKVYCNYDEHCNEAKDPSGNRIKCSTCNTTTHRCTGAV